MTDDRMETITDRAAIRDSDEPDERTPNEVHVDESGCSCKTGPYRGFQRDPIDAACPKHGGPLRHGDGDVTVCHPDGSTTIIREPDERGDFPCCATPAPVGAAMALDLDAVEAEFLRQCGGCDAGLMVGCTCSQRDFRPTMLALVAEVRYWQATAWARLEDFAAAEAEVVTLRARLAAVEALADRWQKYAATLDPMSVESAASIAAIATMKGAYEGCAEKIRAALATTGEGQ